MLRLGQPIGCRVRNDQREHRNQEGVPERAERQPQINGREKVLVIIERQIAADVKKRIIDDQRNRCDDKECNPQIIGNQVERAR